MLHSLWQPPRLHQAHDGDEERKVTWLELFYDLVYVATLIQLGDRLSEDVSTLGFLHFFALFIPIWWAWTGITFYANRFAVDDVWHRLLIFGQILAIAALAISVEGVFGHLDTQFALAYAAIRLILVVMYVRAWQHIEAIRPLARGYAMGFGVGALLWFISAFVPAPVNYVLWAVAIIVEFAVPLSPFMAKWQAQFRPHIEHMAERYGIFTIIVLGESFVKVISSTSGATIDLSLAIVSLFALGVACCLWWLYFDDVARSHVKLTGIAPYVWIYSHLPLAVGITAFGVAAKKVMLQPPTDPLADKYRWLVAVAVALYLVFVAAIDSVVQRASGEAKSRAKTWWRIGAAALILLVGAVGSGLTPTAFIALVAIVFVVQIAVDVRSTRNHGPQAHSEDETLVA